MSRCAGCNKLILFGGIKAQSGTFCTEECRAAATVSATLEGVSEEEFEARVMAAHLSPCPRCRRPGPINVHFACAMFSLVVVTHFAREPFVSCTRCARILQLKAFCSTFCLGWWGIPIGLVGTPFVLLANLWFIAFPPRYPRDEFCAMVAQRFAGEVSSRNRPQPPSGKPRFAPRRTLRPPS